MSAGGSPQAVMWTAAGGGARRGCGADHQAGAGRIDETARRLSHEELAVARTLAADGHSVSSQREVGRAGRTADLLVCSSPVEVKSWLAAPERDRPPGARSVLNKLLDAAGQADSAVLYAVGSGLTAGAARRGMALFAGHPAAAELSAVRIMGDGFDLAWDRQPSRSARAGAEVAGRQAARPATSREWGGAALGW